MNGFVANAEVANTSLPDYLLSRLRASGQLLITLDVAPVDNVADTLITADAPNVYAVEIGIRSLNGIDSTLYAATREFVTYSTDTPALTPFYGTLQKTLGMTQSIVDTFGFASFSATWGEIELANVEADYDTAVDAYTPCGRTVTLTAGRLSANVVPPYASFVTVAQLMAERWSATRDLLRVTLRDPARFLELPAQPELYSGAGGLDGGADLAGKRKPWALGSLLNVSPPLVVASLLMYQVSYRAVQDIFAVYDGGLLLELSADYADSGLLGAAAVPPGSFATCNAEGLFRLGAAPDKVVTCDVSGDNAGAGGYVTTTADLVRTIASTAGNIDWTTGVDAAAFAFINAQQPATIGYFFGLGGEETILSAIARLMRGIGGWMAFDRLGLLTVDRFEAPGIAPVAFYDQVDMASFDRDDSIGNLAPPPRRIRVPYRRNWTVQTDVHPAVGDLDPARLSFLAQPFEVASTSDAEADARVDIWPTAPDPEPIESFFEELADAADEAARLFAIYDGMKAVYRFAVKDAVFARRVGETVSVTYPRFGLGAGAFARIVELRDDPDQNETEIVVYGGGPSELPLPPPPPPFMAFSVVTDRINLLKPNELSWVGASSTTTQTESAANSINQWTLGAPEQIPFPDTGAPGADVVSLSAAVAAPDGTTTAYRVIETADGGTPRPHFLTAGSIECQCRTVQKHSMRYRFEGYAKEETRTRFKVEIANNSAAFVRGRRTGASVIFDVSGGQTTTPVAFGTFNEPITGQHLEWTPGAATITPSVDGFYKCTFEALGPEGDATTMPGVIATITLDKGSGIAAEDTVYNAAGGDSIILWETRLLPAGAEALDTQAFFDDFDSSSTIDLTHSKDAGFKWYTQYTWPSNKDYSAYVADPTLVELPSSSISVAGSVMTIAEPTSLGNLGLMSICWDGTGSPDASGAYPLSGVRGQTFQAPAMFEIKAKWNDVPLTPNSPPLGPVFWASAAELLFQKDFFNPDTTDAQSVYGPNNTIATNAGTAAPGTVLSFAYVPLFFRKPGALIFDDTGKIAAGTRIASATSTTITLDTPLTGNIASAATIHASVYSEFDFYELTNNLDTSPGTTHTPNVTVHDLPGHWSMTTVRGPSNDSDAFRLYQTLWLPIGDGGASGGSPLGVVMCFNDGVYVERSTFVYGEDFAGEGTNTRVGSTSNADDLHFVLHIGGQTQWPHDVDHVAVYSS